MTSHESTSVHLFTREYTRHFVPAAELIATGLVIKGEKLTSEKLEQVPVDLKTVTIVADTSTRFIPLSMSWDIARFARLFATLDIIKSVL